MEHPLAARFPAEANLSTGGHQFHSPVLTSPRVTVVAGAANARASTVLLSLAEVFGGFAAKRDGRADQVRQRRQR